MLEDPSPSPPSCRVVAVDIIASGISDSDIYLQQNILQDDTRTSSYSLNSQNLSYTVSPGPVYSHTEESLISQL